jgi:hypothetical protein
VVLVARALAGMPAQTRGAAPLGAARLTYEQQMRWNRATVQPFLDARTAVLNDTLEGAFRRRYPRFRPPNDDKAIALAA